MPAQLRFDPPFPHLSESPFRLVASGAEDDEFVGAKDALESFCRQKAEGIQIDVSQAWSDHCGVPCRVASKSFSSS